LLSGCLDRNFGRGTRATGENCAPCQSIPVGYRDMRTFFKVFMSALNNVVADAVRRWIASPASTRSRARLRGKRAFPMAKQAAVSRP
jgi:hypothetical protein